MSLFIHRMLGHYLQNDAEDGADLAGAEQDSQEDNDDSADEGEDDRLGEDDEGEVIVTLGDEQPSADAEEKAAPQWVKDLRKKSRDDQRRIRELEQELSAAKVPMQKAAVEVGAKPTLEGCDYDPDKFEAELVAWQDRKRQAEKAVEDQQREQQEAQQAWQSKLEGYAAQKASLKLPDFDDAESTIISSMDVTQQGIIISGADNPALVIYALGRNEAKAKELASIKDPVKFAFAIAKLETQVKMQKKEKPAPEKTVTGTAPKAGAVDSTLERLRADAEKTGDYSKVHQYKRQKKQA